MYVKFGAFGGLLQMSKSRKIVVLLASVGLSHSAVTFCIPAHAREPSMPKFQSQSDDLVNSVTQKAEGGMAEAQMLLAKWRYDGGVLPEDHAEAARWYGMAANQGNVEAMMALGRMLIEGDGIPRDIRKGSEWYAAAARKGDAEAYFQLGRIFETGEGVNRDRGKALKLFIEATKRGNANAAFQIAQIYDADSGADRDTGMRDHYLELAAELGCDAAKEMQSQIQDHATANQPPPADTEASQVTSTAGMETTTGRSDGITEADRRYDQELRRRAEEEWNEQARNTGGPQFAGNAGSGQLDMSFQDRYAKEQQAIQREQRRQQLLQNPAYNPVVQANLMVQSMIRNGVLLGARYIQHSTERVPSAPSYSRGPGDSPLIVMNFQGQVMDRPPEYDLRCYVVYDFAFVTQGGFTRQNRGYLTFSRDIRSRRWGFNQMLSTIDGVSPRY